MKKQYLLPTLIMATFAMLAVGCQKEESTVTLGVKIQKPVSGNSKVYIDDHTPCWHNGDMVYINDAAYPVMAATGSSARIENVTASSSYRAIFPASIMTTPEDDISNVGYSINVWLPNIQYYELVGDHQRVDVPMGAYITSGSTLQFNNLCSIVRVIVSNSLNRELPLSRIGLEAETAILSGRGSTRIRGEETDKINMYSYTTDLRDHSVNLDFTGGYTASVPALGTDSFDIVVPAFETDDVTITLYTMDGHSYTVTKEDVALAHNTITTVTLNVTNLMNVAPELLSGNSFNVYIPNNATAVVFEYNSPVCSGTQLSTNGIPIFGNLDGTTWRVSTPASTINANSSCYRMFFGRTWNSSMDTYISNLETIDFGEGFNTENVTDMFQMFSGCSRVTSLDLSNFNTSNVTNMSGMFKACSGLTNLDVSYLNTSNVTDMSYMFYKCSGLTSLDVSNFNTSNVTNLVALFLGCSGLTNLDVSNFNTLSVTNMGSMFSGCSGLTSLDVTNFNTSNVTSLAGIFSKCSGLTSIDVSNFSTSNVTNMSSMFSGCRGLTSLDVTNFVTTSVTDMSLMFSDCRNLTSLDVTNFVTTSVTNMCWMFMQCRWLTSLDLSNFNTSNVTDMRWMFYECSRLTSLDLSYFDMSHLGYGSDAAYGDIWKDNMCGYLSTISGQCTITCPLAVETAMQNERTNLPTSGVTFTWVRP